ncbi:hypothetical protein EZV61_15995 [Corallincola luteus]|uniref:DUF6795 domain-containing protein n=1 Tax=Corallincola luteus TaxID=1775177 RepID=A0ABY2AGS3_9GAMM|nr:DUF6795 domain-containing protein [Corallincola luteus]TCI01771.1 hypothetical protein EZV61_15995 [Corallincola luteus]
MFGLLKKYDVHLCPVVQGRITLHDKPISGVPVKRWLYYIDEIERVDTTETDSDGRFSFPEVTIRSKLPGDIFTVSRTQQKITTTHEDLDYTLWEADLSGIKALPEYSEKLGTLICDLSSNEVNFTFPNHSNPNREYDATSICRWENDFEIYVIEDDGTEFFCTKN